MYFTLAVSAASREVCAALTATALDADPRIMPIPGPARVAWRAADERAAVLYWGRRPAQRIRLAPWVRLAQRIRLARLVRRVRCGCVSCGHDLG
jgi:hypothetical protein